VLKKIASDYFGENQKLKSPVTLTLQGFFLKNTFVTKPAFLLLIANCGFDYAQPPLCTN
jgi:hypothetical protein